MLGLGLALSIAKKTLGDAIDGLLSTLRGRATYYENGSASKSTIKSIDDADILDKASILLTPTATSNARLHSVKTYTGDELLTNGGFDSDSDWTKLNATISGGKGNLDGDGQTALLYQGILTNGKTYKATFTVSDYNNLGEARIIDDNGATKYTITSDGTFTVYFTHNIATSNFLFRAKNGAVYSIDNVSVTEADADFDFDRASSATRINSSGLVQDMQSITDPELVLNGDYEDLGDEDANYADGNIAFTNVDGSISTSLGTNNYRSQGNGTTNNSRPRVALSTSSLNDGKTYKVVYTPISVTGNTVFDFFENTVRLVNNHDISQPLTFYFTSVSSGYQGFDFDGSQTFSVDYTLSVQQVDPNDRWTLGTGWSISDGKAISVGGADFASLNQEIGATSGNTYKVIFTITEYTSGQLFLNIQGSSITYTSTGTYTAYVVSGGSKVYFVSGSGSNQFVGSIDNISVKDITFSTDVDLARINYDSNGENGHILLEPTSTNLVPYSENFEGGSWTNESIGTTPTLEGGYTAPDGSNSAYKISNANQDSFWYYPSVADSDDSRTIWARTVSGTGTAQLTSHNSNTNNTFNLTETWQRFEVNSTTSSTGQTSFYAVDFRGSGTLTELLLWGAQLEDLPYATSYIPTLTGSTVTRATETLTGSGNSTLINSTEGVLYAEIAALANSGGNRRISISDGSDTNRLNLFYTATTNEIKANYRVSNSTVVTIDTTDFDITSFNKIAFRWQSGNFVLFINGQDKGTNSNTTMISANTLNVLRFEDPNLVNEFYGKCKALAVFNEALSDTELTNLTS
jgi:hypothetical protein